MNIKGSKEYKCKRICTMYVETGRTMESLAKYYSCSRSHIGRYLLDYARDYVDYDLFKKVRQRALQNKQEVCWYGKSLNHNSDEIGSLE